MLYLEPLMEQFSIKDLERLSGINAHTIRIWERRYGLIEPSRTDTNRRRYTGSDLRRIINVAILNRNGFKISKIAGMNEQGIEQRVSLLLASPKPEETEVDTLILAMLALNKSSVNEILGNAILSRGFEYTVTHVMFPFMNRVGIMWQTGTINAGYEHFMTILFRNRLISEIESINTPLKEELGKVMLYLPENDLHELPLLLYAWLFRKAGYDILYLGQMTPADAVIDIANTWKPALIVTGASTNLPPSPAKYLRRLTEEIPDSHIIVAGTFTSVAGITRMKNVTPVKNSGDLRKIAGMQSV